MLESLGVGARRTAGATDGADLLGQVIDLRPNRIPPGRELPTPMIEIDGLAELFQD